jgi:hypothetical protein
MRYFSVLFAFLFLCYNSFSQSDNPVSNKWITDGTVNAIVHDSNTNTIYIGGAFTFVGPNTPYGTTVDLVSGQPNTDFVKPNGNILTSVPDGNGGWYVGGDFTSINGQTRIQIARINNDGSLHPWNLGMSSSVYSLLLNGSTLYVGGSNYLTAIDANNRYYYLE